MGDPIASIVETLELKMAKKLDRNSILRAICLLCVTENGFK